MNPCVEEKPSNYKKTIQKGLKNQKASKLNWSSPLRRETAAAGPSFHAAATPKVRPDYHSQDIPGLLNFNPNCFSQSHSSRPCRAYYKELQCTSHRRRRGPAFSVRVMKYWNKLQASVVTAPAVKMFKKRMEKVWTVVFPHLPHWLNSHFPNSLPLPP